MAGSGKRQFLNRVRCFCMVSSRVPLQGQPPCEPPVQTFYQPPFSCSRHTANQIFTLQVQQATSSLYIAHFPVLNFDPPKLKSHCSRAHRSLCHTQLTTKPSWLLPQLVSMATENSELGFQGVSSFDLFFFFFLDSCLLGFSCLVWFFFPSFSNDSDPSPVNCCSSLLFFLVPFIILLTMAMTFSKRKDCQKSINEPLNVGVN